MYAYVCLSVYLFISHKDSVAEIGCLLYRIGLERSCVETVYLVCVFHGSGVDLAGIGGRERGWIGESGVVDAPTGGETAAKTEEGERKRRDIGCTASC